MLGKGGTKLVDRNPPRAYDLSQSGEINRLHREVYGYLSTCIGEHHGTDRAGRNFALAGLKAILEIERKQTK